MLCVACFDRRGIFHRRNLLNDRIVDAVYLHLNSAPDH